jgi:exosortase
MCLGDTSVQEPLVTDNSWTPGGEWRRALLYGGIGLLIALPPLWPGIAHMVSLWSSSSSYGYAWLVLPFVIYALGWHYREELLAQVPQPEFSGLALVFLAIFLSVLSAILDINLGKHIAVVLVALGIIWSAVGWAVFRQSFTVLALLLLMIPSGDLLQPLLRGLTVRMVEWFAIIAGLPHRIDGYNFYIGDLRYVVVEACSGLSYVTMAAFVTCCLGSLRYRTLWQMTLCAIMGAAAGVLVNGIRVNAIVWFDWVNGTQMELSQHQDFHYGVLLALLGVLALVAARIQVPAHDAGMKSARETGSPPGYKSYFAPVVAGLLVLITLGSREVISLFDRESSEVRVAELQIPTFETLPVLRRSSPWRLEEAGSLATLSLELQGDVHVFIQRLLEEGKRLPPAILPGNEDGGWRESGKDSIVGCWDQRCVRFAHTRWTKHQVNEARHVFFAYFVGDTVTDSEFVFRVATGWNSLIGQQPETGIITFSSRAEIPAADNLARWYLELIPAG